MLDKILEFGCYFDGISPIVALINDLRYGPGKVIAIHESRLRCSGKEAVKILEKNGVKVWGVMFASKQLMMTVKKKQYRWAKWVIEHRGII